MSSESMMVHACTIMRQTPTNVDGVISKVWANVTTAQKCFMQEGRGRLRSSEAGDGLVYDAIGFFPPTADIRPRGQHDAKDRITMTSPTALNGIKFLVELVTDESGMADHLTAYLIRVPAAT